MSPGTQAKIGWHLSRPRPTKIGWHLFGSAGTYSVRLVNTLLAQPVESLSGPGNVALGIPLCLRFPRHSYGATADQ